MANPTTVLFSARVPTRRFRKAEKVLGKLGLKPEEAFNMLLAQIELRKALPFDVKVNQTPVLSADAQAEEWTNAFGTY